MTSQVNVNRIGYMTENGVRSVSVEELVRSMGEVGAKLSYNSVEEMMAATGMVDSDICVVTDPKRGGLFYFKTRSSEAEDLGVRFDSEGGQWVRARADLKAANVDWYPGDDSERVQACMDNNSVVNFTQGETYRMGRKVTSAGKDIRINFNGCNILQLPSNSSHCFALFGGWENVETVASVNYEPTAGIPYIYAENKVDVIRGDIIKISTEKTYDPFQTIVGGEFKEIYGTEVGQTKLMFTGPMRFQYETGTAKVAKLSNAKIEVYGPVNMEQQRGFTNSDDQDFDNMIRIGSAREPIVNDITVNMCYDSALCFWSCYNAKCDSFSIAFAANFQDGRDFQGSGYIGYGIRDCNSTATHVTNMYAQSSRHGYVAIGSGGGDSGPVRGLSDVGPNMHARVYDSMCVGCTNSGYDTHHGQEHTYFFNCVSRDGQGSGYQARGLNTEFHNCVSDNDNQAMMAFIQSNYTDGRGTTNHTVWKGGRVINPRSQIWRLNEDSKNTYISDVEYEFSKPNSNMSRMFDVSGGTSVWLYNHQLNVTALLSNLSSIINTRATNIDLYIQGFKGTCAYRSEFDAAYFVDNDGSNVTFIDDVRIWRANFRNMFKNAPNTGGEITNVRFNISSEVIRGLANNQLQEQGNNFLGPIQVSRNIRYGKY